LRRINHTEQIKKPKSTSDRCLYSVAYTLATDRDERYVEVTDGWSRN